MIKITEVETILSFLIENNQIMKLVIIISNYFMTIANGIAIKCAGEITITKSNYRL